MKLAKQVRDGIMAYPQAIQMIFTRGIWYYYLFPVVIMVTLLWTGDMVFDSLLGVDFAYLPEKDREYAVLFIGLRCIFYFATTHLTNYMVLALLSPALTRLSYQTEFLLTGNTYPMTFKQYLKDIDRALRIILRNMLYQMVWIAGWYIITLPFPASWPFRWVFVFVIGSYFYGFSLMDYTAERLRLNIDDSVKFVRRHFLLAWVLGSIYYGLFIIPWHIGVVVAPVTAIVAGTIAVHLTIDLSKNPYAKRAIDHTTESEPEIRA
jgi:CysZ protein